MRASLGYFGTAGLLVGLGFLALSFGQGRNDAAQHQQDRAATIARATAWVAAQELGRDDGRLAGNTQRFVSTTATAVHGLGELLVLRGTKFVAHSDRARVEQSLKRDSVADKALFDRSGRIKNSLRKNAEAKEKDPALTKNALAELDFGDEEASLVSAAAPVRVNGEFVGMAELSATPTVLPEPLPLSVLLWALLGIAVFALATLKLDKPLVQGLLGGVLLLLQVGASAHSLRDWRDQSRRALLADKAALINQLGQAGLLDAQLPLAGVLPDPLSELGLSFHGEHSPELLAIVRTASAARLETDEPLLRFSAGPTTVLARESALREARSVDTGNLLRWAAALLLLGLFPLVLGLVGLLSRFWRALVEHRLAYAYLSPAAIGMAVLVMIPVVYGIVYSFGERRYNVWSFEGISNYVDILSDFAISNPQNFYFKFAVTVMWTAINVTLHVSIGLMLALLLNDTMLKARGLYRVILVVPWAVPNYITALIWKGMFHKQFGAINFFLEALGVEPISWFQSFWPAFFTNVATNTWLGFPFMMVISLGALQSIPADLYEAAEVDGASRWHRFRYITLPLLMPALVPAVMVGTVWTFNMFNIIYLVSGGAPNGATDILITDAYRWAFERERYGYAAAYSTIIFLILLANTNLTNRITRATKGAFE